MKGTIRQKNAGIPCKNCGYITELREHKTVTDKLLKQPFFYKKWYYCHNKECRTTLQMLEEDKVLNHNDKASFFRNLEEKDAQIGFFKSL